MTYEEALQVYGTQERLGQALGITQSTISSWGTGTRGNRSFAIPKLYQYQLEVITRGRLRADPELRLPADLAPLQQVAWNGRERRQMG